MIGALPIRWCSWRDNPECHAPHVYTLPAVRGVLAADYCCPGGGSGHATEAREVWERSDCGTFYERTHLAVIVPVGAR